MQIETTPYAKYRKTQIMTANPCELIAMLYDGAIKYATQACGFIKKKDIQNTNKNLLHTQEIIVELMGSLKMEGGKMAYDLYALYDYLLRRLASANVDKDSAAVEEAIEIISMLRAAWMEIMPGGKGEKPEYRR